MLKVPTPTPVPRAAPSRLAKNVTARLQGSRGIGRPEGKGEEQGLGAAEAAPGRRVVKDQCPGQGWRSREWAQALHPPGFVKRCTAKGQLERVSWLGPLLPRPQLRDRGSSLRASPPRSKLRAWLPPHPQVPQPQVLQPPAKRLARVLTSALTSASSAAAPRPRQLRSTSSSGSSCGRAAASRPPRRQPAQPGRPGALRSLPMPAGLARLRAPGPRTRLGTCDAPWLPARASANSHGRGEAGRAGPGARSRPTRERAGRSRPPRSPAASAPGARRRASATPEPLSASALRPPDPAACPARPAPSVHVGGQALPGARASRR